MKLIPESTTSSNFLPSHFDEKDEKSAGQLDLLLKGKLSKTIFCPRYNPTREAQSPIVNYNNNININNNNCNNNINNNNNINININNNNIIINDNLNDQLKCVNLIDILWRFDSTLNILSFVCFFIYFFFLFIFLISYFIFISSFIFDIFNLLIYFFDLITN